MQTSTIAGTRDLLFQAANLVSSAHSYLPGDRSVDADALYTPEVAEELQRKLKLAEALLDEVRAELFARQV